MVAELTTTRAALQHELMDARDAANSRVAGEDTERATAATLERRCAELDEACTAALDLVSEAVKERDAASEQLETERKRSADALAAAQTRLKEIDQELAEAERGRQEAQTEADEANAERDELALLLDKAKKSVQGMNAAVEERLAAIDAKRARALKAAEERAEAAIRDRDALAAELAAVTRAASEAKDAEDTEDIEDTKTEDTETEDTKTEDTSDMAARLAAATERIRALELELFERERGPVDQDVELEPLLPAAVGEMPRVEGPPARRYGFKPLRKVQVDREPALLVDLSLTGAQVIYARSPDVGQMVTLSLLSDEAPCFCQGRVMWARREQTAKGRPYRYPAGIAFTTAQDEEAIQAFIATHAVKQE
jgi:hypothetical protein